MRRGGDGAKNIRELKTRRPCGVRRMRWKISGRERAAIPAMYNGARKLMSVLLDPQVGAPSGFDAISFGLAASAR